MQLTKKKKVLQLNEQQRLEVVEKEVVEDKNSEEEKKRFFSLFNTSADLGFSIALPIAGGAIIGSYLDKVWGSAPKATLGLLFLGIGLGIASVFRLINDFDKKDKKK